MSSGVMSAFGGRETNDLFSGGVALDDGIVAVFEMSAESEAGVSEQIAMQLEDCIWGRWNVVVAFVDGGEYVAIAGDFLLGTIVWRGFSCNQCVESLVAGRDTFNTIGCVGALNACNRDECVQQIRPDCSLYALATFGFVDGG